MKKIVIMSVAMVAASLGAAAQSTVVAQDSSASRVEHMAPMVDCSEAYQKDLDSRPHFVSCREIGEARRQEREAARRTKKFKQLLESTSKTYTPPQKPDLTNRTTVTLTQYGTILVAEEENKESNQ